MDVIWLDIEHTDSKKYFTWDPNHFPDSKKMLNKIKEKGRKVVTIVDPHIKRDAGYFIHLSAQSEGDIYIRNHEGKEYEGHCWPGSSSWVDYINPKARNWWADKFSYSVYEGSSDNLFIWNDMNEPSVFNGPEITMPKDALHYGDLEHREIHNIYGMFMHNATYTGLIERNPSKNERPFVLSRSFYSGTQRIGPIWTGDNSAKWEFLAVAQPMLLSLGVAGITFTGADVGGFFGNPDAELISRWYQAGSFYPFFRGHAHIDSKRREPWLYDEPYLSIMRDAIQTRYSYLPYWYTLFYNSSMTGIPIIRPLWIEYPTEELIFNEQDEFLVGSDLLVKPVTKPGIKNIEIYLPGNEPWYDIQTGKKYELSKSFWSEKKIITIETPLEKVPILQRGGSIIPKKERIRRSTSQMIDDEITLVIGLNQKGYAEGDLYIDDGHSFNYQKGQFLRRKFIFENNILISKSIGKEIYPAKNKIEKNYFIWNFKFTKKYYIGI